MKQKPDVFAPPNPRAIVWVLQRRRFPAVPPLPAADADVLQYVLQYLHQHMPAGHVLTEAEQAQVQTMPIANLRKWFTHITAEVQHSNGLVVEYNDIITAATGSASNCALLGSTEQSKSACFYLLSYLGKNKYNTSICTGVLARVMRYIERYPSTKMDQEPTAEAKATRKTKHFLTRLLNTMSGHASVSDTQAAIY